MQWYKTIPSDIAQARVHILDVTYRELHASNKKPRRSWLVDGRFDHPGRHGKAQVVHLVRNDHDFELVPGIRVWRPR